MFVRGYLNELDAIWLRGGECDRRLGVPIKPGGNRLGNFDTLRLVFAILVIFSHSFALGLGSFDREPLFRATRKQFTLGNIGVLAFFVISGFLITQSWIRHASPVDYLQRRVARIYPAFIMAALISAFIVVPIAADRSTFHSVSPVDFLLQTLTLQSFHYPPSFTQNAWPNALNGSLWSVRSEFWCYIGIMFLGMAQVFRRRWIVGGLLGSYRMASLRVDRGWPRGRRCFESILGNALDWANVLPFFLAGSVFHLFGGPALLIRPLLVVASIMMIASNFIPFAYVIVLPLCGSYLLFGLAYLPLLHPLNLGRFGDFSYGTYLYAYPVQQLIVKFADGSMAPVRLFLLAALASLILGVLSWFVVERRFLQRSAVLKHEQGSCFRRG